MLIRFAVENFRSILGRAELSMVAIDDDRPEVRAHDQLGVPLLPAAGIFGPNASGKTNMLAAMAWLRRAVLSSLRRWDKEVPVETFAFGDSPTQDTSFELELTVDNVRFEYLLDVGRERVSFEALYHYPQGRRRRLFEREGNTLTLQRGLGELSGTRALLTDRSLALSIMRRFDEPLTFAFTEQIRHMATLGAPLGRQRSAGLSAQSSLRIFDVPQEDAPLLFDDAQAARVQGQQATRRQAMALLRLADLGIADVHVEQTEIDAGDGQAMLYRIPQLVHVSGAERLPFDYGEESAGTREWFQLIGPLLAALRHGSVVLFDELDASLHPTLTAQLLQLFQQPGSNPKGAQLIFTAHDTNLLTHLNRDQVWLTEKGSDGHTNFGALSDFAGERVRRSQNIESGYLSGRFGALPDVGVSDTLRELGLIG